ncbi:MAG TPA: hypothetical protein VGL65_02810 [Gemmatimonadales bacterium]|jgi:hypothetical protein
MFRSGLCWFGILLVASCSPQLGDPAPTQLSGDWGGFNAQLSDSTAAASLLLALPCNEIMIPGPIPVDSVGAFAAPGTIFRASSGDQLGDSVLVYGRVIQDNLSLYLSGFTGFKSIPFLFTLKRNAQPTWGQNYCIV